jgi:hypothetical protein
MIKLFYKPVSVLVSVLGGMLAGATFKQVWKLTGVWPGKDDPQPEKAA